MNSDISSIISIDFSDSSNESQFISRKDLFGLEERKVKRLITEIPKKSNLKRKKSKSIGNFNEIKDYLEKVKITPKKSKEKKESNPKKKKEVLFSLIPQIQKLKSIKNQYNELLNKSKPKSKSTKNIKFKKKNIESKSEESVSSDFKKRKICHSKTLKTTSNNEKSTKISNLDLNTENINRSFNEGQSKLNLGGVTLRKNSSFTDLITPMPEMKLINKIYAEKVKRFSIMLRRQEYNVSLKKKNVSALYGKKVILIQRTWKRYFKNVYIRNVIKIQKYYRGFNIRKQIINDRLIIIRFVIKLYHIGRKNHFHYFICQMKKLIRAIFFQNEIKTQDISIQVDISIEKKNNDDNKNKIEQSELTISEEFNSEKSSIKTEKKSKKEKSIIEKKEEEEEEIKLNNDNINENKYEIMLDKLTKLQSNGNITGLRNFPRPYLEVGSNLKLLHKRLLKLNLGNENLIIKDLDMKYSGRTNQLIIDISQKKKILNKIQKGNFSFSKLNLFFQKRKMTENELENEVKEKKTFLKSKNINAQEFNILESDKYINLIRKRVTFDNKWSKFTKNNCITIAYRKINLLQKNIKLYLKRIKEETEEVRIKKETKKKVFRILIKEIILNHIRKYVYKKLFPKRKRRKKNSLCIVRRQTTDISENLSSQRKTRNRNISTDINNQFDSDSVIVNDDDIYIFVTKDNIESRILEKYNIDKNDVDSYYYS